MRALLARLARQKKRIILLAAALGFLILAAIVFARLQSVKSALITQSAAKAWQGASDTRFAQVTAFLPPDAKMDEAGVFTLRQSIAKSFADQSIEAPEGGSLSHDAYCGSAVLSVSSERSSLSSVKTLGVGGDWFFFHPLRLLGGGYISERDFMNDRVVLDEDLAWTLFGSADVEGLYITVGTHTYPIAGVVRREDDFASAAAIGEAPIGLYMHFEPLLQQANDTPVTCYEIVMPNPVTNYAANTLTELLAQPAAEVVENTDRFSLGRLLGVLWDLPKRSMMEKGIVYPYWENAARYCESSAAILLFLLILLLLPPITLVLLQIFHYGKRYLREGKEKLRTYITARIEQNKEKHYTREGI